MIPIKTPQELEIMLEGGKKLAKIKEELKRKIAPQVSFEEIEELAQDLIKRAGGKPSFAMVPGYRWATCLNLNEGVVHGIPQNRKIAEGDIVSVDVGIFYKGFHTDTSITCGAGKIDEDKKDFLRAGERALEEAIKQAKPGNRVGHISLAMEKVLRAAHLSPIEILTGHGVGEELHEQPQIPCFLAGKITNTPKIFENMVFAIEVIYAKGNPDLVLEEDGWTLVTKDAKIAGLFEETVAVTNQGPLVLTRRFGGSLASNYASGNK